MMRRSRPCARRTHAAWPAAQFFPTVSAARSRATRSHAITRPAPVPLCELPHAGMARGSHPPLDSRSWAGAAVMVDSGRPDPQRSTVEQNRECFSAALDLECDGRSRSTRKRLAPAWRAEVCTIVQVHRCACTNCAISPGGPAARASAPAGGGGSGKGSDSGYDRLRRQLQRQKR